MRAWRWLVVSAGLLGGCHAGSLEPVHVVEDEFDAPPEVVGTWVQVTDKSPAELVVVDGNRRSLDVHLKTDGDDVALRAVPFKAPGGTYVDVIVRDDVPPFKAFSAYVLRPHFLVRVDLKGDRVEIAFPSKAFVRGLMSGKGALHGHATGSAPARESDFVLFTSPSADIRKALARHHAAPKAWDEPIIFQRKK